jgi:hypothetical protein
VRKLQEQLQQRGQSMSDQANEAVQKDVEYKRNHAREMKEGQQNEQHPYKGTIIDYSG